MVDLDAVGLVITTVKQKYEQCSKKLFDLNLDIAEPNRGQTVEFETEHNIPKRISIKLLRTGISTMSELEDILDATCN